MRGTALRPFLGLLLAACSCGPGPGGPAPAAGARVRLAGREIAVTVARTEAARARGLRGRDRLGEDEGLLYVWPRPLWVAVRASGHRVAADLAFLGAGGEGLGGASLPPGEGVRDADAPLAKSPAPARYALALPSGWLARHGAGEGARAEIPAPLGEGAEDLSFPSLPRATLRVGGVPVAVELALTRDDRERGLMFRNSLPADTGMLFVYPEAGPHGFWMKNCCLSLTAAYTAGDGRIAALVDMAPAWLVPEGTDPPSYPSPEPVPYVLEMEQGWFGKHGLRAGDRIELPPEAAEWRRRAER
ncbi:MAG: DUF192 domain-containing protein [Planctomycetales bacterium]|nr:DUF192 domain-containing protein [Planctomycetales bacterium]